MNALYVRLRAGGEHYALPVDEVLEVVEAGPLAAVPGAPATIAGVRNLRGRVVPVVKLADVLGLTGGGATAHRVLVAEAGGMCIGLEVEDVLDVEALPVEREEAGSEFLSSAALVDGSLVGVLELGRVVSALVRGSA